jgi:FAD/FMN-containing dehydrogenase
MQFAFVPREHNIATEQYVNALRWRRWLGFEHGIQATIRLSPQELLQQMAWWPALPPETLDCMRLVKQALDPAGVLNPARFSTSADS